MAINHTTPDIALLLETVREEVKARRLREGNREPSALERQLDHCLEQLEITRVVSAHWPLEGRNPIERAWILVHKVVRRGLRWYVDPIVEQQNAFNDTVARALHLLTEAYRDLQTEINKQESDENGPKPLHSS